MADAAVAEVRLRFEDIVIAINGMWDEGVAWTGEGRGKGEEKEKEGGKEEKMGERKGTERRERKEMEIRRE